MIGKARGFVLRPGEGRTINLGGFEMSIKATAQETDSTFSLLEADEPPNFGPPLHIHTDAAEAFYILEGEYIVFLDSEEFLCPAGTFIFIPAGIPHGFRVGRFASRKLVLYAPAAMVGYFEDLSEAIRNGAADDEVLGEIADRYSMKVIGPVPEGYL